ncbi:MAG: TonB family protein [Bdellovibrio sp.]|jgi:TonB family protein
MTARRLILENKLGQKVRAFQVESNLGQAEMHVIYRLDNRRVEILSDLSGLNDSQIDYQILKTVTMSTLTKGSVSLTGLGRLRMAEELEKINTPSYELAVEDDEEQLKNVMKKTAVGHLVAVVLMIGVSALVGYFTQKKDEPQLVTIVIPQKEVAVRERVQVSEKKIQPIKEKTKAKVADRTTKPKIVTRNIVRKAPPVTPKYHSAVRNAPERSLERVGALAALGGIKTGARNAEGLDSKSLKNIRSAGVGSGGGGVGDAGSGGIRGMMPGSGLIAGSAGGGGRAQSAGGYGTKGAGGGKAGYGKISLIGGTSGLSLPMSEEALVEGGLDRDQIAAVINRHKGQIIYCYEQGLQREPDLRGRVSVDFTIGSNGRITSAKVAQSSLESKSVESCMVAKMRTWQFPRPVGSVNVDVLYPFELRRVSSR